MLKNNTYIVVGMGYGDEGKGATVDTLASQFDNPCVIRFNGGQQAGHNVHLANGFHHEFGSLPSRNVYGTSIISRFCTINPTAIYDELMAFNSYGTDYGRLLIDESCFVTTYPHIYSNRYLEDNAKERHGSVGVGFGETVRCSKAIKLLAPTVSDLNNSKLYLAKVGNVVDWYTGQGIEVNGPALYEYTKNQIENFQKIQSRQVLVVKHRDIINEIKYEHDGIVFEGAQGFLLDELYGEKDHNTWSNTTPQNAISILEDCNVPRHEVTVIGCLRSYATRHGFGFFHGEGTLDTEVDEPDRHTGPFMGPFRTGKHYLPDLIDAIKYDMPDFLSISHADKFDEFQIIGGNKKFYELGVPVGITGYGPNREDRMIGEI